MKPKVVAIVQARMGSSRLPGKVLLDIAGQPMLARVVARTARAATVDKVLLATTTDASDDPVAAYCASKGIACARGDQFDVLDRYFRAARPYNPDVVVRITADCPVIDPELIDEVVAALLDGGCDFACNRLPPPWHRTYPIGLDTEACTFAALEKAWKEAQEPQQREHVMPYFYENVQLSAAGDRLSVGASPRAFRIAVLNHVPDYGEMRWTVDTPQDLEFIRQVYARFAGRDDFTWKEVLALVRNEPKLAEINAAVRHKNLEDVDKRWNV